jgi:hypothetical protein
VVVQQELFMLSVSQEIYSQKVRLVFQNRGKLFESQYRGWALRLLVNIDRGFLGCAGMFLRLPDGHLERSLRFWLQEQIAAWTL